MEGKLRVKVGGEFACFTRPEFKVERVSYPVMTPSAARGILEAMFWKPEFRYEIREIWVLRPIKEFVLLRNELSHRQSSRAGPIFIEKERQQRSSLVLKDVEYLIVADMILRPHATDNIAKYLAQFERRVSKGQFHHVPYLGTREFAAWFEPSAGNEKPIEMGMDIGTMLFDIAFVESSERDELEFLRPTSKGTVRVKGYAEPLFFHAKVEQGILRIPQELYHQLYVKEAHYA